MLLSVKPVRIGIPSWICPPTCGPTESCGLLRRDYHPDVEIGFAFLPGGRGHGYVFEAATAVLGVARSLKLDRIVAITALDNQRSIRVLEKLGFRFERTTTFGGQTGPRKLFVRAPAISQDAPG